MKNWPIGRPQEPFHKAAKSSAWTIYKSPAKQAANRSFVKASPYATIGRMWRKLIDFSMYLVVRMLIALIQALPLSVCEKTANLLATVAGRILRIRGNVVEENLRIAFPEMSTEERDATIWQMWRHLI